VRAKGEEKGERTRKKDGRATGGLNIVTESTVREALKWQEKEIRRAKCREKV